jgi:hypothetical protein
MKRIKWLRFGNGWIALFLLLANGLAWVAVAGRVGLTAVEPILHPEVAEIRAHWQARDAVGESFSLLVTDQMAAETIAWFIEPRTNLPFSHPQVEFYPDSIVGGGFIHMMGLRTPIQGRATVRLVDGKPIGTLEELQVAGSSTPQFVLDAIARAQAVYDELALPIEITRLELREGEALIEGVYR